MTSNFHLSLSPSLRRRGCFSLAAEFCFVFASVGRLLSHKDTVFHS
jgi:hypothetical protein